MENRIIDQVGKEGEYFLGDVLYPTTGNVKRIVAWDKKFTLDGLQEYLIKRRIAADESNKKHDLIVNVNVESGATDKQISSLKEVLRKANIQYVNYSSDTKEKDLN